MCPSPPRRRRRRRSCFHVIDERVRDVLREKPVFMSFRW